MTVVDPRTTLPDRAIARLQTQKDSLSPSLRRVAEHVLRNPEAVLYQTITELATVAGVGEATITRLCHRLNFAGFHAFKIALTLDLSAARRDDAPTGTGARDFIARAAHQTVAAVEGTGATLDPAAVERVAAAIVRAPRVDVTGQGNSFFAAQFFAYKLMRLGFSTFVHADPHISAVSAATLSPESVLIGITRSGSTIDTVQNLEIAGKRGVFTVAITNNAASPATKHAREVLFTAAPEGPLAGGAISSLTSQLLALEVVYLAVYHALPSGPDAVRDTAEAVVE